MANVHVSLRTVLSKKPRYNVPFISHSHSKLCSLSNDTLKLSKICTFEPVLRLELPCYCIVW